MQSDPDKLRRLGSANLKPSRYCGADEFAGFVASGG